jgi:linoleoyl-CoA desaturase
MQKPTFQIGQQAFFLSLKSKVDHYFQTNQLSRAGGSRLFFKSSIQFGSAVVIYLVLILAQPPVWAAIPLAILLGLHLAMLGFNVMHEGGHQSFSRYKWVNEVAAYFLNVLGGNTYFWKIKHNINHHTYTNIHGSDSDINVEPFMRLHPSQPLHKAHRFQHVYWFFLYGISYIAWVFYEDFVKYFSQRIATHAEVKPLHVREHVIFWVTKIFYVTIYLAIPVYLTGWAYALVGYLIVTFTCGLFISIVFQLAHVVENTHFPVLENQTTRVDTEWAVHQLQTTSNFATHNRLLFWMLGGLNFQIEHHLFPRVSHIHYPAISKFVRETCKEFNVTYQEYSSMWTAFVSHLVFLYKAGRAGVPA